MNYLISIPKAMQIIGVTRYTIEQAIKNGTLEAKELEGRTYVTRPSIESFLGVSLEDLLQ